jgi:hypothetical protein
MSRDSQIDSSELSLTKISNTLCEFIAKSDGESIRVAKNRYGKKVY